jgi:hypothetical protein
VHEGLESVLEGPVAKVDDLATRHAVVLAVVELIGILAGRESDVTSSEEEDPVALTAFAEIETARSFEVREVLGSNLKTKYRSEGNAYVDCGIDEGDVVEELRSSVPGANRLTERKLDVGDRILQEELLAARGRAFGLFGGERTRAVRPPTRRGDQVPYSASAKRTGSMLVHLSSIESKNL